MNTKQHPEEKVDEAVGHIEDAIINALLDAGLSENEAIDVINASAQRFFRDLATTFRRQGAQNG